MATLGKMLGGPLNVPARPKPLTPAPRWGRLWPVVLLPAVLAVLATLNFFVLRGQPFDGRLMPLLLGLGLGVLIVALRDARAELQRTNAALEDQVTHRTRALQESEARFVQLFQLAPQAMLLLDQDLRVLRANHRAEWLFAAPSDGLTGLSATALFGAYEGGDERQPPEALLALAAPMLSAAAEAAVEASAPPSITTLRGYRRKDEVFFAQVGLAPMHRAGEIHIVVGVEDVTEQLAARRAVDASLREKEMLLQEIHHRVKNNLQIVSSMLSMQSEQLDSEQARGMLSNSVRRVRSMALVHQQLYGVENLARIDLGAYTESLVRDLQSSLAPSARVQVVTEVVEAVIDQALPFGLILNELITNAMKYGMSQGAPTPPGALGVQEDRDFDIRVVLSLRDGALSLSVADSGPGLPRELDVHQANTLGLDLVRALTRQLRGTLHGHNDGGARFMLTYPCAPAAPLP